MRYRSSLYRESDHFMVAFGIWMLTVVIAITGWVANIVQIVQAPSMPLAEQSVMFFLKVIGILAAPLGVVLGWIGIFS